MNKSLPGTHRRLIIGYPIAVLLVLIYLNMFPVVRYIVQSWGTTPVLVLPILITLTALAVIVSLFLKTRQVKKPDKNCFNHYRDCHLPRGAGHS